MFLTIILQKDHRIPRLKILYTKDLDAYIAQPNMLYLAKIEAWEDINHPLGYAIYRVDILFIHLLLLLLF